MCTAAMQAPHLTSNKITRTLPGILGWTSLFLVNFHYSIVATFAAKSSSLLSLLLHYDGDTVKTNLTSSSTFVTTHDTTCKDNGTAFSTALAVQMRFDLFH